MDTVLIYHPVERDRADLFAHTLESKGFDVAYAPLGLQVGTPEWIAKAQTDISNATSCILLLTKRSVLDEWVARRTQWALDQHKMLVPVTMDVSLPDHSDWTLPREVFSYNWFSCPAAFAEPAIEKLVAFLPKPKRPLMCFMSYSRADSEFLTKLRIDLERHGIAAWRDIDDIPAGSSWDDAIEKAIAKCSHVVLVVSNASIKSANVGDEIGFARERKKPIIPILIDDSPLPLRVHRAQAVDFRVDYDEGLQILLRNLDQRDQEVANKATGGDVQ